MSRLDPSPPLNVRVSAQPDDRNKLKVEWDPPATPAGEIDEYVVVAKPINVDLQALADDINICDRKGK